MDATFPARLAQASHAGRRCGTRPVRAASIVLLDAAGKPLPVGSTAHLEGADGEKDIVGFDGVLYLDNLSDHNSVEVDTADGSCHVSFQYPRNAGAIPLIGPLTCREESAP